MKFFVVFMIMTVSAVGMLGIQNVAGQECDAAATKTLVDQLYGAQSFIQSVFSLVDRYTFHNMNEYVALELIRSYNQSAFDALDQGNCSALNQSVLSVIDSIIFGGYTLENDSTAIESGLYDAYFDCEFPNETCDINYLDIILDLIEVLGALINMAAYALIANQCDTLNVSLHQIAYTVNRAAELIFNGSNTNVSDALTTCLFPTPTCSVNDTLITIQTELSCIITLNSSFVLNDSLLSIIISLEEQNSTTFSALNSSECDILNNATATIVQLIQNFIDIVGNSTEANDTGLACELNKCLYDNVTCNETCSIGSLNDTLNKEEPTFDCLCVLEYEYDVSDYGSYLLDKADKAYVEACLALEEEDNCTAVSEDVQLFIDIIQEFINYTINSNKSSIDLVNAVSVCATSSSTTG